MTLVRQNIVSMNSYLITRMLLLFWYAALFVKVWSWWFPSGLLFDCFTFNVFYLANRRQKSRSQPSEAGRTPGETQFERNQRNRSGKSLRYSNLYPFILVASSSWSYEVWKRCCFGWTRLGVCHFGSARYSTSGRTSREDNQIRSVVVDLLL
jgi:hypothetical protein